MGQNASTNKETNADKSADDKDKKPPKKFEFTTKKKRQNGPDTATKLPHVVPYTNCRLKLLKLERIKDYLLMEQDFVAAQQTTSANDKNDTELFSLLEKIRGNPMRVGRLLEMIDDDHAIVSCSEGQRYVNILSFVDRTKLELNCSVLLHFKTQAVVGVLTDNIDPLVSVMKLQKAPVETYADIGGLEIQIQEIREAVELPLTNPELYEDMGIKPPKGVILYGPPGTGKTLLARAVANKTSATFLKVVGTELIQKYLGDGAQMVRDLFKVAKEYNPSIVFIDEIDAIGSKRYSSTSGGTKEVQRTMLELLNQLDGFDDNSNVKVIMATNCIQTLDSALIRPGRVDRKIEFPIPSETTKRHIFQIHTARMKLAEEINFDELIKTKDDMSGADIKAICTEAGLLALRERRMQLTMKDFESAKENVMSLKRDMPYEDLYS